MSQSNFIPSKGHLGVVERFEFYLDEAGELWRADVTNVIDVRTGYRIGRWEAPAWQVDMQLEWLGLKRNPEA